MEDEFEQRQCYKFPATAIHHQGLAIS
jgi:hypothetical protein